MEIKFVDVEGCFTPKIQEFASRRVMFALAKFDSKMQGIVLSVRDLNGPKGGNDKECTIQIRFRRGNDMIVSTRDNSLEGCIARCCDRTSRALVRRLSRIRDSYRRQRVSVAHLFS